MNPLRLYRLAALFPRPRCWVSPICLGITLYNSHAIKKAVPNFLAESKEETPIYNSMIDEILYSQIALHFSKIIQMKK